MNDHTNRPPTWLERESVVPLAKVEKITSLDRDTIKRRYPDRAERPAPGHEVETRLGDR
jgi:hypothetical protein